ncbi:hypothetical protein E2C01_030845 [Portunus trituberculatus]|uniref:Uncharacterized protein n=1 Tax=Portunus trituberculatus TaxID=210409 RepID=A0A5B7ES41_PORTR|nr:hypothetical protein [Portunus trituberculatus]
MPVSVTGALKDAGCVKMLASFHSDTTEERLRDGGPAGGGSPAPHALPTPCTRPPSAAPHNYATNNTAPVGEGIQERTHSQGALEGSTFSKTERNLIVSLVSPRGKRRARVPPTFPCRRRWQRTGKRRPGQCRGRECKPAPRHQGQGCFTCSVARILKRFAIITIIFTGSGDD